MSSPHHLQSRNISQPGILPYQPVQLDLTALVREVVEQFDIQIRKKDLILSSSFIQPEFAFADRQAVRLILRKLIGNAIRYTPKGGTILVSSRMQDGKQAVMISDSGSGMPTAQIKCLSEPGVGNHLHGLLLCKELVMLNNGTIRAESFPGFGTDVCFTLPKA